MKCPHCLVTIHDNINSSHIDQDESGYWVLHSQKCPDCNKLILHLGLREHIGKSFIETKRFLVYPKGSIRPKAPIEVPEKIAEDFNEACLVLDDSLKASAALSRRCLQTILRETDGIKKGSLNSEIDQAIEIFPSYIADAIDAVRHIGNFAAHPLKSESTGEIISVEPGEAEWLLDVLEQLFDFCYVQPLMLKKKREQLNEKLKDLGKPELKTKS